MGELHASKNDLLISSFKRAQENSEINKIQYDDG